MRFLVAFDLPLHDNPEREFERPTLTAGRRHAKQMELTLRMFFEREDPICFFLFVYNSKNWIPHYRVKEWPEGWFMGGWGEVGCNYISS